MDFKGRVTVAICVPKTVNYKQWGRWSWKLREGSGNERA